MTIRLLLTQRELATILHAMNCWFDEDQPVDLGLYYKGHYGVEPLLGIAAERLYEQISETRSQAT